MKILVTGASGFIGRNVCRQLSAAGDAEVVAASRSPGTDTLPGIRPIAIDLLDGPAMQALIARERPTHLLHLAWNATPGIFWTTQDNLDWTAASLMLQRAFQDAGGQRIVMAGTCAEYDWALEPRLDEDSPTKPATLYGVAKDSLKRLSLAAAQANNLPAAWGRVFWLYGPAEAPNRLVSDIAAGLAAGREIPCSAGLQERDFLHVADVAGAFVAALRSDWCGAFNIGSGLATPVRDIAAILGRAAGRDDLIKLGARPSPPNEIPRLVADIRTLRDAIGFTPVFDLESGLADTYAWWRQQV